LGLLDLDDHFGPAKDLLRTGGDARAGREVLIVGLADRPAQPRFDQHVMAARGQFAHARRSQAGAVFVVLDFLGDAYEQGDSFQRSSAHSTMRQDGLRVKPAMTAWSAQSAQLHRRYRELAADQGAGVEIVVARALAQL